MLTDEELAALGLEPGATREQISAAILGQAQGGQPQGDPSTQQPETPATEPTATPTQAPADAPAVQPAPTGTPVAAPQVPEGMVLVDSEVLKGLQEGVAASSALVKRQEQRDRDEVLDSAIRAGKFGPGRRKHYENLLLSDPVGGKATILSLADGVVPVAETVSATVGSPEQKEDTTSYPAAWAPSVSATRRGLGTRVKVVND